MRIKYNLMPILFSLFLFAAVKPLVAQNLDSLEKVVAQKQISPEEMLRLYNELSLGYASNDLRKAKHYAFGGVEMALKNKDDLMTGTFYRNIGIAYYMFSQLDSALIYLLQAKVYAFRSEDLKIKTLTISSLGNLYNAQGKYPEAINNYMEAMSLAESDNNKQRITILCANLSGIYCRLKNWPQAEKYLWKTIELANELGDKTSLGQAYNSLSDVYLAKENWDKAIEYEKLAIELFRESGNTDYESIATQGMAMIYYKMPSPDFKTAEEWAQKALLLSRKSGLPRDISGALCMMSNVYLKFGKNDLAEKYALQSYQTDSTDADINGNIMGNLVWTSIRNGQADKAIGYMEKYRDIIDERATHSYQSSLSEMEVKYETEKKEMRIAALEEEKRLYGIITMVSGLSLVLFLLFLYQKYKSALQKKKMAEQKVAHLEQEKQLIATQAVLDGETAERSRLARDLHDGLGGMLSVVKLKLNHMRGNIILPEADVTAFHHALDLLDGSIGELRRIARNLMPESLMRYGLKAAISDFCQGIDHVKFHYYGNDQRHPEKMEIALFRTVQELVNNAIKHSAASQINVQLIDEGCRISMVVQDNGIGFEPGKVKLTATTGLNSVRSRIESLGGKFDLLSSPGNGTEAHVDLNVKNSLL